MKRHLTINVLGVREDDEWCAIALELSLRGYGETFEQAMDELAEAVEAQFAFAVQNDTLDSIFFPAEPEYIKLYADLKRESIKSSLQHRDWASTEYAVSDIPLPKADPEEYVATP